MGTPLPVPGTTPRIVWAEMLNEAILSREADAAAALAAEETARIGASIAHAAANGMDLYQRFSDLPDGALPATASTGQTWEKFGVPTDPDTIPEVFSGKMGIDYAGAGTHAGYLQADLGDEVVTIGAAFSFTAGSSTNNGNAVLLTSEATAGTWGPTPDIPCHLVINKTGWVFASFNNFVETVHGSGTFDTPLVADGATIYTMSVVTDKVNARAYVTLPDGNTFVFSHANFALSAPVAGWEPYRQATTDPYARFSEVWASTNRGVSVLREIAATQKAPLASPTFTGTVTISDRILHTISDQLTASGAVTLDSAAAMTHRILATGNITSMTVSNAVDGATLTVLITPAAGQTVVWASDMRFVGGSAPTPVSGSWVSIEFMYEGLTSRWIEQHRSTVNAA